MTNRYYSVNTDTHCTKCGVKYNGVISRSTDANMNFVDWCDDCDDDTGWVLSSGNEEN